MKKLLQIVDKAGARLLPRTEAAASGCGTVTTTYSNCSCDVDCSPDGGLHAFLFCHVLTTSQYCPSASWTGCTNSQCV